MGATDLLRTLTPKEYEIAALVKKGLSNKEVADKLGLALGTIKGFHLIKIYKKLKIPGGLQKSRRLMVYLFENMPGE